MFLSRNLKKKNTQAYTHLNPLHAMDENRDIPNITTWYDQFMRVAMPL